MKRLKAALFCLSVVLLCYWNPVHHGLCSEPNQLGSQNQPQAPSDVPDQQDESEENRGNDKDLLQDPPAVHTVEHQTPTDTPNEPQTQETTLQDNIHKEFQVNEAPAETEIPEADPESSVPPEDDAGSQNTPVSTLPAASITESQTAHVSEDLSFTATVSPVPSVCSDGDDSCSSSPVSPVSPTAACDAGENPSYDADINSLPLVLDNGSSPETGKSTKAGLGRASQGTNASSMLKEQNVPVSTETDPALPSKDPEDIPTFDEWKKIMMEVENEKSQTTHTSCNGGSNAVKKVQKTTNYASVECGAKILASNPEAKSTSAILMENVDVYMLNPCSNKIWFVIELCQPIQVKQLDIANFELFSSTPKDFLVSISDRYPTNKWSKLGTFHAREERTVQSFPLDEHLYAKYVKVELLSHFGSEHFCPLSLLRVFGTSMMEEYELNSEPSERLNLDEDDDYPPGYVPSDDKSSKNLIGSAKDAILNMVNNIAANVLGGNPEDGAQSEGNYTSLPLNLTETPGTPDQTVSLTSSKIIMDSLETDQHEVTATPSVTEGIDTGPIVPTTSLSETATLSATEPVGTTPVKEEQIVTLLAEDLEESDKSANTIPEQAEIEREKSPQNQQYSGVKEVVNFREHTPDSCSWVVSLKEYLLQRCSALPVHQGKKCKKKSKESHSQPNTSHKMETSVPVIISSSLMQELHTATVETTTPVEGSVVVVPAFSESVPENRPEAGSVDLAPSLISALVTLAYPDTFASRATHVVDFLDPLDVESSYLTPNGKRRDKAEKGKNTPILTCNLELTSTDLTTVSDEVAHVQMSVSTVEKSTTEENNLTPSMMTSTIEHATLTPLSTSTDQSFVHPTISKSPTPAITLAAVSVTEPLEEVSVLAERKREELVEEVSLGDQSGNIQTGQYSNGQPSSNDFYAEIPSSTEAPMHGSNQKESVFMRLNNRIKALEVNMSLSGRYLEQLSQRYRKQMEEMQKAFNKTIIKLQNTSRMAEDQDQKQTESIQVLQRQLQNVTQLVLKLSLQVSQLQREVSDRHSYLLLSVILGLLICTVICVNYCRMSAGNLSTEPDPSVPNSHSSCCPDRDSPGYEYVNPKRRASYPFSQSSLHITTTEGPSEAYNVETRRNSTGTKKKKRCKMKSGRKPETITPTLSVPNGGLQCNQHCPHSQDLKLASYIPGPPPFSFRDSPSEGSSEDSSQSDEPSFCGITSCSHLCDPLPAPKSRSKKRNRLKKKSTVLEQLLQPVECNGPPVASKFTLHGLITGSTELNMNRPGVPLLPRKNSFD
ncbi:SUN domain-containing ossification factor-like isoform X2 [Tachysurus fulvidraco]|uniref:SUN domain-containing ossification factor-like isoform X2 n=1 Tax=Tachysurus fulvidraco TaxID=1234273 RepID=UPI001FEFDE4B|nr:SUN domain-containing ossification factor-like isoform X2 [Tachysurus fulvidraco]